MIYPSTPGHEGLKAAFYRFLDQWLHKTIESTGIVVVARSGEDGYDVLYQSRWSARSTWPVAYAAQVQGSVIIDGFAVEPMHVGGERVGALVVARPGSQFERKHIEQIRDVAELAAPVVGVLPAAAARDERQVV